MPVNKLYIPYYAMRSTFTIHLNEDGTTVDGERADIKLLEFVFKMTPCGYRIAAEKRAARQRQLGIIPWEDKIERDRLT